MPYDSEKLAIKSMLYELLDTLEQKSVLDENDTDKIKKAYTKKR